MECKFRSLGKVETDSSVLPATANQGKNTHMLPIEKTIHSVKTTGNKSSQGGSNVTVTSGSFLDSVEKMGPICELCTNSSEHYHTSGHFSPKHKENKIIGRGNDSQSKQKDFIGNTKKLPSESSENLNMTPQKTDTLLTTRPTITTSKKLVSSVGNSSNIQMMNNSLTTNNLLNTQTLASLNQGKWSYNNQVRANGHIHNPQQTQALLAIQMSECTFRNTPNCLQNLVMAVNNTNIAFIQRKYLNYCTSYMQYNIVNSQFNYTQYQQIGIRNIQQQLGVQTLTTTQHALVAQCWARQQNLYASSSLVAVPHLLCNRPILCYMPPTAMNLAVSPRNMRPTLFNTLPVENHCPLYNRGTLRSMRAIEGSVDINQAPKKNTNISFYRK